MTKLLTHSLKQARILLFGAAALSALTAPALAASACAPREQIAASLASQYHEKPVGMGVGASGSLVVIFASPAGTWTAVGVAPSGSACVLDVGDGWTDLSAPGVTAQAE